MDEKTKMVHNTVVINDLGMHARPAAQIVQIAMAAESEIWLSDGNTQVDASSIIDILTLCATKGARIHIRAKSFKDAAVVDKIKSLFDDGFGELTE